MPAACSAAVPATRRFAPSASAVQTMRPPRSGRHARHDVQPARVGVGPDRAGLAGLRVDREYAHVALIAAGHDDERPSVAALPQVAVTRYGNAERIPADLRQRAVERRDVHRDDGVRRACRGVAHCVGWPFRVRRVGDVPDAHRSLVHPGGQDGRAVGRPPVAAVTVHLLGRDELGQSEADSVRTVRVGDHPVLAGSDFVDVQRPVADVSDQPAGRV